MKKIIVSLLLFAWCFAGKCQTLTVTIKRDSAGEMKMNLAGSKGVKIDSNYTILDALRDCDSVNQIRINALKKQIAALKKTKK